MNEKSTKNILRNLVNLFFEEAFECLYRFLFVCELEVSYFCLSVVNFKNQLMI